MGYALAMGLCINCGRLFSFNPNSVPSIRVRGVREPVCRDCMAAANRARVANGLEPLPILPDAYDPVDESELP